MLSTSCCDGSRQESELQRSHHHYLTFKIVDKGPIGFPEEQQELSPEAENALSQFEAQTAQLLAQSQPPNEEQMKEQRQIELLKILAKGCKKHPAYRAIRKATERCEECVVVWQARVELNALEES